MDARLSEALSPQMQQEVEEELAELQANEAKVTAGAAAAAAVGALPSAGTHEPEPQTAEPARTSPQASRQKLPA